MKERFRICNQWENNMLVRLQCWHLLPDSDCTYVCYTTAHMGNWYLCDKGQNFPFNRCFKFLVLCTFLVIFQESTPCHLLCKNLTPFPTTQVKWSTLSYIVPEHSFHNYIITLTHNTLYCDYLVVWPFPQIKNKLWKERHWDLFIFVSLTFTVVLTMK